MRLILILLFTVQTFFLVVTTQSIIAGENSEKYLLLKRRGIIDFWNSLWADEPVKNEIDTHHWLDVKTPRKEIHLISQNVDSFFEDLKFFVNDTSFDYIRFEESQVDFGNDLSWFHRLAENNDANEDLTLQINFAAETFRIMARTARYLRRYTQTTRPLYSFFRKLLYFRVKTLTFYNSHGALDPRVDRIREKVHRLSESVGDLVARYNTWNLGSVSIDMHMLCEAEIGHIRETIEDLRQQLPRRKTIVVY